MEYNLCGQISISNQLINQQVGREYSSRFVMFSGTFVTFYF